MVLLEKILSKTSADRSALAYGIIINFVVCGHLALPENVPVYVLQAHVIQLKFVLAIRVAS